MAGKKAGPSLSRLQATLMQHCWKLMLATTALMATFMLWKQGAWPVVKRMMQPWAESDPLAVPALLIIGTAKTGTTDVWAQLVNIRHTTDEKIKEFHALTSTNAPLLPGSTEFESYLTRLDHPCARRGANISFVECARAFATGTAAPPFTVDATPVYLEQPSAPSVLQLISPRTKVMLLLREPVERSESLFNHWRLESQLFPNTTISQLAEDFLRWINDTPKVKRLLAALAQCTDPYEGHLLYTELVASGLLDSHARSMFSGALYSYALNSWRANYLLPNRCLIMSSDFYFSDRLRAMGHITNFLHGREMNLQERVRATNKKVYNAKRLFGNITADSILVPRVRVELQQFFDAHTQHMFHHTLPALKHEGCTVMGFKTKGW